MKKKKGKKKSLGIEEFREGNVPRFPGRVAVCVCVRERERERERERDKVKGMVCGEGIGAKNRSVRDVWIGPKTTLPSVCLRENKSNGTVFGCLNGKKWKLFEWLRGNSLKPKFLFPPKLG